MKVKIQQSGDDLIILIPESWIEQLNLHDGDEIELSFSEDMLATISERKKTKYRLEDLLEGIDENNINRGWGDDFPVHP